MFSPQLYQTTVSIRSWLTKLPHSILSTMLYYGLFHFPFPQSCNCLVSKPCLFNHEITANCIISNTFYHNAWKMQLKLPSHVISMCNLVVIIPKLPSRVIVMVLHVGLRTNRTKFHVWVSLSCIWVKSVTYCTICTNFMVESTGLWDGTTSVLRQSGNTSMVLRVSRLWTNSLKFAGDNHHKSILLIVLSIGI